MHTSYYIFIPYAPINSNRVLLYKEREWEIHKENNKWCSTTLYYLNKYGIKVFVLAIIPNFIQNQSEFKRISPIEAFCLVLYKEQNRSLASSSKRMFDKIDSPSFSP